MDYNCVPSTSSTKSVFEFVLEPEFLPTSPSEESDQSDMLVKEISSKCKDTSVTFTDTVCSCVTLKQPESAHPKDFSTGSLQLPKPAKTFPIHLLVQPFLYGNWPHPKVFTHQQYPMKERFLWWILPFPVFTRPSQPPWRISLCSSPVDPLFPQWAHSCNLQLLLWQTTGSVLPGNMHGLRSQFHHFGCLSPKSDLLPIA